MFGVMYKIIKSLYSIYITIYVCNGMDMTGVVCGVTRLSGHVLLHFSWRAGISNISPANNYQ